MMNSLFPFGGMLTDWLFDTLTAVTNLVWFKPVAGMYFLLAMLRLEPLLDFVDSWQFPLALDITLFF